ncbi:MAG TPA: carbohydrate ABC transporter permease [Anaerolineales bacterium]|nr:carbohydrate ABC transporter permease [Anaerolineales bacterium]
MNRHSSFSFRLWNGLGTTLLNGFAWLVVAAYLFPILYMVATSLKTGDQFLDANAPLLPAQRVTYEYEGKAYALYYVPAEQGLQEWALVVRRRAYSEFIDPAHPEQGLIRWDGYWGSLKAVYRFEYTLDAFEEIWDDGEFLWPVARTLVIAALGGTGALVSSILVAYGFARYPVPAGRWLFILLIASIMLPEKVTLIPTYFMYARVLKWIGTWLPLIVPHFFGNAIMIFLLRQNFKSISKDIEEAAILDGAGPLRLLISIILPQATPTVITVALLQFFYFWNETRQAALYLSIARDLSPVSFWLQTYSSFFPGFHLLQASALMVMIVPILVVLLTQRIFMQGVVVTDSEK